MFRKFYIVYKVFGKDGISIAKAYAGILFKMVYEARGQYGYCLPGAELTMQYEASSTP